MTSDIYDSDDAMNRSPQLKAQTIQYGVQDDPPPFAAKEPECVKGTPDRSRKHQTDTPKQTRFGDRVLIGMMGPDYPDVALHAQNDPLELSPRNAQPGRPKDHLLLKQEPHRLPQPPQPPPLRALPPPPPPPPPRALASPEREIKPEIKIKSPTYHPPPTLPLPVFSQEAKPVFASPPRRPRLLSLHAPPIPLVQPEHRRSSTSEGFSSPPDSKPFDLKSRFSLPSLQPIQSPPSSLGGPSPESGNPQTQTLPSISSALGPEFSSRMNGFPHHAPFTYPPSASSRNDSPHDRQFPSILPQQIPPSPFSQFSPLSTKDLSNNPSPASQPSLWRTPTSAVSTGPPLPPIHQSVPPAPPPPPPASSDAHQPPTPYEMSPMTAKSPTASYPTPTEPVAPTAGERASFSSHPSPNGGITSIGSYKCTHPGCTAAPFQTQYLLNSHANVHSQDRPHFCPVDGCPRGVGGKGFKRKNEMMRHGLVHNSPGYVCPFCPDQQHKYPRPDNLQRHVRVHHVDKSKDDPILRQVLAQRPIGSTRGRRRRLNG